MSSGGMTASPEAVAAAGAAVDPARVPPVSVDEPPATVTVKDLDGNDVEVPVHAATRNQGDMSIWMRWVEASLIKALGPDILPAPARTETAQIAETADKEARSRAIRKAQQF